MPSANTTVSIDQDFISPQAKKLAEADASPTILSRTRILSSQPLEKVAHRAGIAPSTLALIEAGTIKPSATQQTMIRKAVSSSSAVLFEKQTPETRAAEMSRF